MSAEKVKNGFSYELGDERILLRGRLVLPEVNRALPRLLKSVSSLKGSSMVLDLGGLEAIDSAGVIALTRVQHLLKKKYMEVKLKNASENVARNIETFGGFSALPDSPKAPSFLENLGDKSWLFLTKTVPAFIYLAADIFVWSFSDLWVSRYRRKGSFVEQAVLIGVNALAIVTLMAFLIGLVLALQSAAQLRQFGANIFIVDLTVIAMTREMGPLITAIIVAGRSGSAIASEIATMKVTEELDALATMALSPIRFVVIPKMQASVFTMPMLTILATVFGIMGGMAVAFFYLDISPMVFINRMGEALYLRDIFIGVIKSIVFATLIVLTGSFFGFRVKQGAEGVGRVTTSSVVVSISLVIVADSILGLIFY